MTAWLRALCLSSFSFCRYVGEWHLAGVSTPSTYKDQFSWSPYTSLHNSHAKHHLFAAAGSSAGFPLLSLWDATFRLIFLLLIRSLLLPVIIFFLLFIFPLGFTVYKGISTYEYIKMRRQKQVRNQDTEAGNPEDAQVGNKDPKVRPVLCHLQSYFHMCQTSFSFQKKNQESSIDCEPALSQSSR